MNLPIFETLYGIPLHPVKRGGPCPESMGRKEERSGRMSEKELDWEISEDYYNSGENERNLSLEDFITESDSQASGLKPSGQSDELLKKTIADVHQVLALAQEGKNITEIAFITGLQEKYVYDIQVCAQGFREDDEIAVAHLVLG
jgi:hypothetical protein